MRRGHNSSIVEVGVIHNGHLSPHAMRTLSRGLQTIRQLLESS